MSASAGRVLIIPRGDYDSQTTYTMLDMVYYGGKSYICKQTSTGNLPTNTVYWQIMIDSASALNDLSDVDITSPQNGDGIAYNATTHKWENTSPISISITSPPAKTEYSAGEILDLTGMVVTALYSTGTSRNITSECTFSPANGTTLTASNTSVTVSWLTFTATQEITVTAIYGVEWDGSSTTSWTRTDASANFVDPVPYYSGMSATPSSPFDSIMPWSGMVVEERTGGTMVKIPKFYYKLTKDSSSLKIQISATQQEGFHISPAHMDRGDGAGERDYVYVGRYHSSSVDYLSRSGDAPKANVKRNDARISIRNIGTNIWQFDFATRFTIWMLYLVEYADWNSQAIIGAGGGNGSSAENVGASDSMPYHTGTMQTSRSTNGVGVQYRHIEGLWDNVYDYCDGCYYSSQKMYIILNPSDFSDSSNGTLVGTLLTTPSMYPKSFDVVEPSGFYSLFFPTSGGGSDSTYTCDQWIYSLACAGSGGDYRNNPEFGLFYMNSVSTSNTAPNGGCRLMELP